MSKAKERGEDKTKDRYGQMVETITGLDPEHYKKMGRAGGKKSKPTSNNIGLTPEKAREMGRRGAIARWKKAQEKKLKEAIGENSNTQ